jgi:hypothetical protein
MSEFALGFMGFIVAGIISLCSWMLIKITTEHFFRDGFERGKQAPKGLTWEQAWRGEKGQP